MEYDFRTNIVLIADDFYDAYQRCREGKHPIQIDNVIKYSTCNVPAIVNGAFALELYFKSMLPPKTRGHELKELYDNLSSEIKCEIKNAANSHLNKLAWGKQFEEYLEDLNNVFEAWRYIHEKEYAIGYLGNRINEYLQVLEILIPVVKEIAYEYRKNQ